MLFRESQCKLIKRVRIFLWSGVVCMRNSWDPQPHQLEGLDSGRTRVSLLVFRSDVSSAGLFAKIRDRGAGLSAAVWDWRKGGFGVGTRVSYCNCRQSFVLGDLFLHRWCYTKSCKTPREKRDAHAVSPLVHKGSKFTIPAPQTISDR